MRSSGNDFFFPRKRRVFSIDRKDLALDVSDVSNASWTGNFKGRKDLHLIFA